MAEPFDDAQIEAIAQRVKDLLAQERCSACQCSHGASEQPVQDKTERPLAEAASALYASRIGRAGRITSEPSIGGQDGIYPDLDSAVAAAGRAFRALDAATLDKRHEIIAAVRAAMRANAELLARMAWEETGLGRVEDKIKKNHLVIDKTPGPEILQPTAWTGDRGLALIERAPYGVFGVITPVTNPTSTIINNAIGLISAGNAAVFNVHPSAKKVSSYQIQLINRAIVAAGGPPDLLTAPAEPTIESAQALMRHPGIRILLVTGGGAVVKLAMTSGKRAICAGPGNPPVVVDETADIDLAGKQIVFGASFDNNIICIDEKEVFAVDRIADKLKAAMVANGAVELPSWRLKTLERVIFEKLGGPREHGVMRKEWIGQNAGQDPERDRRQCAGRAPDPDRGPRRPSAGLDRAAHAGAAAGARALGRRRHRPGDTGRARLRPYCQHVQPQHRGPQPHGARGQHQHLRQERPVPGRPRLRRRRLRQHVHRQPDRRRHDQRADVYACAAVYDGGSF